MTIILPEGAAPLSPRDLGTIQGRAFAELAVELRLKGLAPEAWSEWMCHRCAALCKQFDDPRDVDAWAEALQAAYVHCLDHDLAAITERVKPRVTGPLH